MPKSLDKTGLFYYVNTHNLQHNKKIKKNERRFKTRMWYSLSQTS
jgi:hypothetical protein